MSTLYLIPMPLGDPDDITLRALRILREVSAIVDFSFHDIQTLLDHHGISAKSNISADHVLEALAGGDVAIFVLGRYGFGDQVPEIVREAIARGIRVEPLPGASAEITALVLSGLPTDAFVYVGTLPDDLSVYAHERDTMIFKTHLDVLPTLQKFLAAFGDRRICIAMRLTTPEETIYRGIITIALTDFQQPWAGEFLLVVEGAPEEIAEAWDEARVRGVLRQRLAEGEMLKKAAKAVAAMAGWDRRAVYALGVDEKRNTP